MKLILSAAALALLTLPLLAAPAEMVDQATLQKLTATWPNRPRLALMQMIAKYGQPQEATAQTVIWHDAGPYKRITLNSVESPHNFPKPHMDFLQHTISMKVPSGKADELEAFDGSNTVSRTEGEISARCDSEAHNVLTLNLIHDLLEGKKSISEARTAFDKAVEQDMAGPVPDIMVNLQFDPSAKPSPDPDKVTIPGAPEPMTKAVSNPDAEVLCVVAAIDENEILAAEEAEKRKLSPEVLDYARMMHTEHGKNIAMVMKMGVHGEARAVETEKTDILRVKGAGELAALVPLDDAAFGPAYIKTMVQGHQEALQTIDDDLVKSAKSEPVKKFLTETREHVAMHLEVAKKLQSGLPNQASNP